jgi:acyl-CoA synthetase (AMP-forming)/AMP-acid ligase II
MCEWFLERLREFADRPGIIWQGQATSYLQVLDRITAWREQLDALDVRPGETIALGGQYSPGVCSLLLALVNNRNIIVPLDHGGADTFPLDVGQVGAVFAFNPDDQWTFMRRKVPDPHLLLEELRSRQEPGLILFTSGSTGDRKAVLLSFKLLLERFRRRRRAFRTLVFMSLDHIGGINTLFHTLGDGGTVIPSPERTPARVGALIKRHRIQLLPTTPTFLTMLLISEIHKSYDLSSLELITYGTEPMPASTLERLTRAFPAVRFKQTYGLSELGIVPTRSEHPESLWLELGTEGCEHKVVNGTLWLRTSTSMLGYLNAPSPFDDDGWFDTGDAVERQGEYLRILGRASELINVGGAKVYPAEVENVLIQMENVRDVTVYGRSNPVTGQVVAARISVHEPEAPERLEERMQRFCQGRLEDYQVPVLLEITDGAHYNARFKKTRLGRT